MEISVLTILSICMGIIMLALIISVIIFLLYLGPKNIIKTSKKLLETSKIIDSNKSQSMLILTLIGRSTKQIEIFDDAIKNLSLKVQNISSMATNLNDLNNEKILISDNELENIDNKIIGLKKELYDLEEKTIDSPYINGFSEFKNKNETENQLPFIENTIERKENTIERKENTENTEDKEESKYKIVGEEFTREEAEKEGYKI